jgi:hypothetical protein
MYMWGTTAIGAIAACMALSVSAQAAVLPVANTAFTLYTGSAPKNGFNTVNPTNWTLNAGYNLVYVDAPGTATSFTGGYGVAGNFVDPPSGGNFVQADGNPTFENVFYQTITGLTPGATYSLGFWQAAAQQAYFSGATTEQWIVALGANPLTFTCSGPSCAYSDPGADIEISPLMNTPSQGVSPWEYVTLNFTASSATQVLSFLAWGDGGSTVNDPPTVFLAGINTPVPEAPTLAMFGFGLAGVGYMMNRRAKRKTQA